MRTILRLLGYSFMHIRRNVWQSFVVVIVLTITLYIAQMAVVAGIAGGNLLTFFERQPQVTIFFTDQTEVSQIEQIKAELEKDPLIQTVTYISKEQAVEIYKSQHQDDPELLQFVTPEILPASLGVSTRELAHLAEIAQQFEDSGFVERVIYQQDLVSELQNWVLLVRKIALGILAVALFNTAVIIVMAVAMNVNRFAHEIEVMRLVGAANWYIRFPFVLDSLIFTILASMIASGMMFFTLPIAQSVVTSLIAAVDIVPNSTDSIFLLWRETALLGSAFTVLASYLAVWRYLRI